MNLAVVLLRLHMALRTVLNVAGTMVLRPISRGRGRPNAKKRWLGDENRRRGRTMRPTLWKAGQESGAERIDN